MRNKVKPELLAPAGNLEKLKIAFMYGADAVYIGGRNYSLRANADNFSIEEMREAAKYAHQLGKKIYVAVNIVFHEEDVEGLPKYLKDLESSGIDAIIITDPFIISLAKKHTKLDIFLSTQQSVINVEAAKYYEKEGLKRIILGREASGNDIKTIIESTNVDIEVFIHGAMCVNYSGRCVLSNYLTARDANRGGCSQICRWSFQLKDSNANFIENDIKFSIAPKDLSLFRYVKDLMDMGVVSFKIEGRMRSIYYLGTIIRIYRLLIDDYFNGTHYLDLNQAEQELYRCANRDSVAQYFDKKPTVNEQYYTEGEVSNQDFLGVVVDYDDKKKEVVLEQRNYFQLGDEVEIFGPSNEVISFVVKEIKDGTGNLLEAARHPKQIVRVPLSAKVKKDYMMRIKIIVDKTDDL